MQRQDEAALAALSLVPLCLTALGVGAALAGAPSELPNMPLFLAGGILGELLLANRKLASMQRKGPGAVALAAPWATAFAAWFVFQRIFGPNRPEDQITWLVAFAVWSLALAVDLWSSRTTHRHEILRLLNCLAEPREHTGRAGGRVGDGGDSTPVEDELIKLVILGVLFAALTIFSIIALVFGWAGQGRELDGLKSALRVNYLTIGLLVCGWEAFQWARDFLESR